MARVNAGSPERGLVGLRDPVPPVAYQLGVVGLFETDERKLSPGCNDDLPCRGRLSGRGCRTRTKN